MMLADILFQVILIMGVLLLVFQMQTIQKYEDAAGPAESHQWNIWRRLAITGQALGICWIAVREWQSTEAPTMDVFAFFSAFDANLFFRIIVMRKNIEDVASGRRHVLTTSSREERAKQDHSASY